MTEMERKQMADILHELRVLAAQAKQRGDLVRSPNALPPTYWYCVQFAYEDAIERLEALMSQGTTNPPTAT